MSLCTKMPYVLCDEETFDDEVLLYYTEEDAQREGKKLIEQRIPIQIAKIEKKQLLGFLKSDTARRMQKAAQAGLLEREKPFVMSVPAEKVWDDSEPGEEVLIQGIIDVFWEEDDGVVLLDYKTDRVNDAAELIHRYRKQLELYADALTRLVMESRSKKF